VPSRANPASGSRTWTWVSSTSVTSVNRTVIGGLQSQTVAERPPGACPFPYSGLGKVCIQMPLQRSRDMPKFPKFVAAPCDATGTPGAITAIQ